MPSLLDYNEQICRKLASRHPLGDAARHAIANLPLTIRTLDPGSYLVREGQVPQRCGFIVEGFAFRQKLTFAGNRQIMAVLVPGDFFDLQNLYLNVADHNVQVLTTATVAEAPLAAFRALAEAHPAVARAMWIDTLIEASIFREWIMNIGRRNAPVRLAHLLCEFHVRLRASGLAEDDRYELPMTQEQLGDALGLTPVHINRVLKALQEEGLIFRRKRYLSVVDWQALRVAADFSELYLHPDQALPPE